LPGDWDVRKEWTKTHELVGVPDGCLNSYAQLVAVPLFLAHGDGKTMLEKLDQGNWMSYDELH